MQKSSLVAQFFNNWKNPTYGEQIAQAFPTVSSDGRELLLRLARAVPSEAETTKQKRPKAK